MTGVTGVTGVMGVTGVSGVAGDMKVCLGEGVERLRGGCGLGCDAVDCGEIVWGALDCGEAIEWLLEFGMRWVNPWRKRLLGCGLPG